MWPYWLQCSAEHREWVWWTRCLRTMVRRANWRTTGDILRNDSDGRGGPLHIRDCAGNIGCEGLWGYGSDGVATSDPGSLHSGTQ